jgi:hypothetical protein
MPAEWRTPERDVYWDRDQPAQSTWFDRSRNCLRRNQNPVEGQVHQDRYRAEADRSKSLFEAGQAGQPDYRKVEGQWKSKEVVGQ